VIGHWDDGTNSEESIMEIAGKIKGHAADFL
jgi:hypothetical protein